MTELWLQKCKYLRRFFLRQVFTAMIECLKFVNLKSCVNRLLKKLRSLRPILSLQKKIFEQDFKGGTFDPCNA